jgi:hypothetical protein
MKMIRLMTAILFTCCLTSQLGAQLPQEQGSVEKTPAAAPPAKTPYPIDAITDFSAVMVGSFFPQDERESHIYRSGKLMRMEGHEGLGYYVTDLTTQETYHVWAAGCARDNHVYFRAVPWAQAGRPGYKVERTASGKETVDGHSCKIEDITTTAPELTRPLKMRIWEAEDLQGFPIKIEYLRMDGHNKIVRYKNVVLGPQDPTLFIHPKSCEPPIEDRPKAKKPTVSPKAKTPPPAPPGASSQK